MMKKDQKQDEKAKKKKLLLKKENLRVLTSDELAKVHGGDENESESILRHSCSGP
jgi:hypothetical protein